MGPRARRPTSDRPARRSTSLARRGDGRGRARRALAVWIASAPKGFVPRRLRHLLPNARTPVRSVTCGRPPSQERPMIETARSADGTTIAYERTGSGPPLVLVGGAF